MSDGRLASPSEALAARVRAEYAEMPGLCLSVAQACRLWQMERSTCEVVLDRLVADGVLARTAAGAYIALPAVARAVKATLAGPPRPRRHIA